MPVNAASHVKAAQTCVISKSLTGRTKACHFKSRQERNTLQLGADVFFVLWLVGFFFNNTAFDFGHVSESNQC